MVATTIREVWVSVVRGGATVEIRGASSVFSDDFTKPFELEASTISLPVREIGVRVAPYGVANVGAVMASEVAVVPVPSFGDPVLP